MSETKQRCSETAEAVTGYNLLRDRDTKKRRVRDAEAKVVEAALVWGECEVDASDRLALVLVELREARRAAE